MRLLSNVTDILHRDLYFFCSERLKEAGLTTGLMYFILYTAKNPDCTPTDLGEALGLDRAYVLRCLKKLTEDGFMVRKPHPTDGRASLLHLTGKGEGIFQMCREMIYAWDEDRLKELTDDEKDTLFSLMAKITTTKGRKVL